MNIPYDSLTGSVEESAIDECHKQFMGKCIGTHGYIIEISGVEVFGNHINHNGILVVDVECSLVFDRPEINRSYKCSITSTNGKGVFADGPNFKVFASTSEKYKIDDKVSLVITHIRQNRGKYECIAKF